MGSIKIPTIEQLGLTFRGLLSGRYRVVLEHAPASPEVLVYVTLATPDATSLYGTGERENMLAISLKDRVHYEAAERFTIDDWRAFVAHAIQRSWMHELDEGLLFDGKHWRDPHPELKKG